ncbi:hypothetical protein B0H12DRAFT_1323042 [Mycena haematopus]|nr:hypothetical protein B0H12DRAFT_1323042 [Mycena haematopus]
MTSVPTPIRAITTPLRSSAAPPIPPPAQLYEPLAKAVLRRRLTHRIFPGTFLVALLGTVSSFLWFGHRFGVGSVLGAAGCVWVGGVLPVVVLRKGVLTVTRTSAPSPLLLLQKSLAPPLSGRTAAALQTHVVSALCVLAVHVALDPAVPVFIKSRKHPFTPHPVLVLLALTQCILAGLYVLRAILRDVWVFPFRRPSLTPSPSSVLAPLCLALLAPPAALVVLFVVLPVLRRVPIVSLPLRPLLHPHLSVLRFTPRAAALAAQTAWAWEAAAGVWGWGVGEPLHTHHATPTARARALVSGISVAKTPAPVPSASVSGSGFSTPSSFGGSGSFFAPPPNTPSPPSVSAAPSVSIYTHLAYAELLRLASSYSSPSSSSSFPSANSAHASSNPAQTAADTAADFPDPADFAARTNGIFGADGEVWARLVREALVLLGREYRVLVGRGVAAAGASASVGAGAGAGGSVSGAAGAKGTPGQGKADKAGQGSVTPAPLLKKDIFAPSPPPKGGTIEAILGVVAAASSPSSSAVSASGSAPAAPRTQTKTKGQMEGQKEGLTETDGEWQWRPLLRALIPLVPALPSWVRGAVDVVGDLALGSTTGRGKTTMGRRIGGLVPRAWTQERAGRAAAGWVPRREVVVEAVGVLTHLTCASLAEDRFGVVQRDIPRVMEALVAFLGAVEEAQAGLGPMPEGGKEGEMPEAEKEVLGVLGVLGEVEREAGGGSRQGGKEGKEGKEGKGKGKGKRTEEEERAREERARARAVEAAHLEEARGVLGEVGDALTDGIARIVRTFGDKLRAFRFPPRTAARLQGFVEYA